MTEAAATHKAVTSSRDRSSNILKKTGEAKAQTSTQRGTKPRDSIESPENVPRPQARKNSRKKALGLTLKAHLGSERRILMRRRRQKKRNGQKKGSRQKRWSRL
jgi:hypothetical protein